MPGWTHELELHLSADYPRSRRLRLASESGRAKLRALEHSTGGMPAVQLDAPQRHASIVGMRCHATSLGATRGSSSAETFQEEARGGVMPEERDGFLLHLQRYHYLGFHASVGA